MLAWPFLFLAAMILFIATFGFGEWLAGRVIARSAARRRALGLIEPDGPDEVS